MAPRAFPPHLIPRQGGCHGSLACRTSCPYVLERGCCQKIKAAADGRKVTADAQVAGRRPPKTTQRTRTPGDPTHNIAPGRGDGPSGPGARGFVSVFKLTSLPFPLSLPSSSPPRPSDTQPHSNQSNDAAHQGMTTQAHDTLYSPVNNPSQFSGDASGSSTDTSSNNTNSNAKRDESIPFLTTPSATAMDSQTTPNPVLAANVAVNAMHVDVETSTHDDEVATTTTSTTTETALNTTTTTAPAATAAPAAATAATVAQQGGTKEFYFGTDDEEIVTLNLNSLLPKKTKHGRIGGSLYRALRDAGVDVAALGIPRGRPPRTVVGQKRPKRPTLLSLIKSGAELPMVPGAPKLRIVNIEMVPEEYEGEEGGGGLQDLTNKQQRRRGGGRRSTGSKRKVGGMTGGNKRAKVAGAGDAKQGGGGGGGGQEGPMEGLVADDEAATGLLLLLGETSS